MRITIMKILSLVLIVALLPALVFGAVKKDEKKPEPVALTGEKVDGDGYKVYFSKDKSKFLKVSGYTRFQVVPGSASKVTQPYFRFYFEGQTSEKWSFHTRFDNLNIYQSSKKPETVEEDGKDVEKDFKAPGVYFARAYATYKYSKYLSIDFGRTLNQIYGYDVLEAADLVVGNGVNVTYSLKTLTLKATAHYIEKSGRWSSNEPSVNERAVYGFMAGYKSEFKNGVSVNYGFAVAADDKYEGSKMFQVIPHLHLKVNDSYFLTEYLLKNRNPDVYTDMNAKSKADAEELYLEVGTEVNSWFSPDLYAHYLKVGTDLADIDWAKAYGVELVFNVNKSLYFLAATEYKDNGADKLSDQLSYRGYIHYTF